MKIIYALLGAILLSCNASAQLTILDADAFQKAVTAQKVQLLDVRTMEEFKRAHITGALQADWYRQDEFQERSRHLDSTKPVYVYCQSGVRSHQAALALQAKGFSVFELQGGIGNWQRAGKPVESQIVLRQTDMDSFRQMLRSNGLTLVNFSAKWCAPCLKMKPALDTIESKYSDKVKLIRLEADAEIEISKFYKANVIPYFILFKDGKEVSRFQGYMELKDILEKIKPFE